MKKNTRKNKKHTAALTQTIRKRLASESRALGLTQREYLELVTQLAATLRQNVWPKPIHNSEILRTMVENPALLQMMISLAGTLYRSTKDDETTASEPTSDTASKKSVDNHSAIDVPSAKQEDPKNTTNQTTAPAPLRERPRYVRDPLTGRPIAIHTPPRPLQ
ncbi:hypothetical protein [Ferroacidibacillus organovorans]|uniref:Uncharacterized protein n=1 Tax=Ferroacidibacillus organovorans TaxID=1765683 RepID=A0A101XQC8_9BACL|nr:hypothetical protein [Ferroacidibacillus organovorans]KUO95544.1 hypothetical protein ATW55_06555 [Ferroacidibacillus organovorans]